MRLRVLSFVMLAALVLTAVPGPSAAKEKKKKNKNPDVVTVQHILISFKGRLNKPIERNKKEAKELAWELFDRTEAGEDFDALVKEYTNDSHPGIYTMTNRGAAALPNTYKRADMATSFGDVSFKLDVGEVGMANFNPELSPFGWHIIKRLE
jgi:parvulin-like peptidyl-prolyl isomerase